MVAVRSGPPAQPAGQWYMQWRNVREDFKRFFDLKLDHIDAVALMTDCDNSRRKETAYYGDIYFAAPANWSQFKGFLDGARCCAYGVSFNMWSMQTSCRPFSARAMLGHGWLCA
jgi:hypothetical protein